MGQVWFVQWVLMNSGQSAPRMGVGSMGESASPATRMGDGEERGKN